jgi:hypothetical protein
MARVGRMELWSQLGRLSLASDMMDKASAYREENEWRQFGKAPHGVPWHGSFHGSSFPGDDERLCERKLIYGLVGTPTVEPFSQMLRGTMIVGQACEDWRVDDLVADGRLLSPPNESDHQMRFEAGDHWLSASPDIVVLPPFTNRPVLIETKTKDLDVVVEMKDAKRSYDAKQARQCRVNIALGSKIAHLLWPKVVVCKHTWRIAKRTTDQWQVEYCRDHREDGLECLIEVELLPMQTGVLLYMGRDRPNVKHGYFFEHDEEWFQKGLATLERVKQHFLDGVLPEHPFSGKEWSVDPCRFCDYKREVCKPDAKAKVADLASSNITRWANEVHGHYDLERVTEQIIKRWTGRTGYRGVLPENYESPAVKAA